MSRISRHRPQADAADMLLRPSVVRFCGYALVLAAVMDSLTLLTSYATPAVRATYVVMIGCYLTGLLLFKLRKQRLLTDPTYSQGFVLVAWSVVSVGLMVRFGIALFTAGELSAVGDAILSIFVGLIIIYLIAFILFDKVQATIRTPRSTVPRSAGAIAWRSRPSWPRRSRSRLTGRSDAPAGTAACARAGVRRASG